MRFQRHAVQGDLAAVSLVKTRENLHQSGFSCSVFSHQRVDGPPADAQIHPVQRPDARKRF